MEQTSVLTPGPTPDPRRMTAIKKIASTEQVEVTAVVVIVFWLIVSIIAVAIMGSFILATSQMVQKMNVDSPKL